MVRKNGSKIVQKIVKKIVQGPNGPVDILPHALGRPRTSGMKAKLASHTFHFLDKFYFDYASLNLSCFVDSFRLRTTANPTAIRKDVLHYQETKFLLSIFPSHLC